MRLEQQANYLLCIQIVLILANPLRIVNTNDVFHNNMKKIKIQSLNENNKFKNYFSHEIFRLWKDPPDNLLTLT